MTDEDNRAAAWREQVRRRAIFIATNEKRLRGSVSARKLLEQQWAPIINRTQPVPTEDPEDR